MTQPADGALLSVRLEDLLAEGLLVKPSTERGRRVLSPDRGPILSGGSCQAGLPNLGDVVDRHFEAQPTRIVAYDIDGPGGQVVAGSEAVEHDQGQPPGHRGP